MCFKNMLMMMTKHLSIAVFGSQNVNTNNKVLAYLYKYLSKCISKWKNYKFPHVANVKCVQ